MSNAAAAIFEGPPLTSEVPSTSVPRFIRERARRWPDRVALIEGITGRSYRYGDLDHLIGRFAAGLAANGFKPTDTLLMFSPNLPEWPIAALGAMAAGGIVSGANPMCNAAELAHQMRDANAHFVFTTPAFLDTVHEAAKLARCDTVILLGEAPGTLRFAALAACQDHEPAVPIDPHSPAALPYSSGTTGMSKGVVLTHLNLVCNVCQYLEAIPPPDSAVTLALLPMFHIYGLTVVTLCGLASGATAVTLPRFEPDVFLQTIARYRVSHLAVVPPLMQFLAAHPLIDAHDLSSLKEIGCGAAPLGAALEQRVSERLRCTVAQGFGMTEASGVIAVTRRHRTRIGSLGQLLPGTQARIVDPVTHEDLARGASGELWFRGPQAFKGYLNQPAATAAAITENGWVKTGDLGHFDDEGYLYITDRLKEMIKVKGFQVAPSELEALLMGHPLVADAAVIGRPDVKAGEIPVAYIVARSPIDMDGLKAWVAASVVEYKRLGDIVLCDAIPKTPAGKILRRDIRNRDARRAG